MIVIDTLRADRMSAYGWPRETTPNLDRLALEGTRFADVTAQSSWTKPSMVSLWTGQYLTDYQDKLHADQPHLPEELQRTGYHTLGVVGNVLLSDLEGFDRGFEHYDARRLSKEERRARRRVGGEPGPCRDAPVLFEEFLAPVDAFLAEHSAPEGQEDAPDRPPLFAYLHPMEPHTPYLERPELAHALPRDPVRHRLPEAWQREVWEPLQRPGPEDDPEWASLWDEMGAELVYYERELLYLDALLGELLEGLEERGLLEQALVVIASDHGEALFEHEDLGLPADRAEAPPDEYFHRQHGRTLYQELVQTPLILWGAGVPAGRVIEDPVENVDLFPTLLELCDAPFVRGLDGLSLVPYLRDEPPAARDDVHAFVATNMMIREVQSDLKLMVPTQFGVERGARPELFDLGVDPDERDNLIEARPEDVARLLNRLEQWRADNPTLATHPLMKDKTTLEDLRALGYLGAEEDE